MVVPLSTLAAFGTIALGMVLTPGPNMAYLVSRTLCQGRLAGLMSLAGVGLGFVVYVLLAAFGITALLFAVPLAYDALRLAGAAYLGWMAWQALRPGGRSPFQVRYLPADSPRRLFAMGSSPACSTRRSRRSISRCCRNSSMRRRAPFSARRCCSVPRRSPSASA